MKTWTVYQHIFPNGKSYVGITSKENPYDRFGKDGKEYGHYIGKAIKKYGWENVTHIILESGLTQDQANEKEKLYIKQLNTQVPNGYNITAGGEGRAGYKHAPHSQETRDKISKTKTGVKLGNMPELQKLHISQGKLNSNYKHSEETKSKISKSRRGIFHSEKTKQQISKTVKEKQLYKYMFTEDALKKCRAKICIPIEQLDENGNVLKTFETATACAKYFNCSISYISNILSGKYKTNKYNIRRKYYE